MSVKKKFKNELGFAGGNQLKVLAWFDFQAEQILHLSSLHLFHLERKHNPSSHHSTTDHVPEKKFKSEALLSTLTSDASKENTPGNPNCLSFHCFLIRRRET